MAIKQNLATVRAVETWKANVPLAWKTKNVIHVFE